MAAALVGWLVGGGEGGMGRGWGAGLLLCFHANALAGVRSTAFFFQEALHERFICPAQCFAIYINIFPPFQTPPYPLLPPTPSRTLRSQTKHTCSCLPPIARDLPDLPGLNFIRLLISLDEFFFSLPHCTSAHSIPPPSFLFLLPSVN